jgi:hypothetical protein
MMAVSVKNLPSTGNWIYELKFDGYRAIVIKSDKEVQLVSRNRTSNSFRSQFCLAYRRFSLIVIRDQSVVTNYTMLCWLYCKLKISSIESACSHTLFRRVSPFGSMQ